MCAGLHPDKCSVRKSPSGYPDSSFYVYGGGGKSLETIVNNRGRLFGRHNVGVFFQFKPTPEVTPMLKEIGALIYDIRTLGDNAIERWS